MPSSDKDKDNICNSEDEIMIDDRQLENNVILENNYNSEEINKRITKDDISSPEKLAQLLISENCEILNIFEIKEFLDSGSESMVYKVINKKTQKPYVMKIIIIKNDEKRNYNEFNILNKLKNDNINRFYGMNEIKKNEVDFVIMEYGKFGNIKSFMKNLLKKDYLSETLLCFFSYQILNGLKYCHINKICHFDIKPYNIIINDYLKAKIIDFSVSIDYSKINTNTIKLPFCGTNFYMAPEMMESKTINKEDLDKIDLYSLGVTLYNLAFGTYPYDLNREDSKDYETIYYKIKNNKLEFDNKNNIFSLVFIDFLKKLLEKDIDKRININEALNHDWIKGANILFEEKEKTYNISNFLINLITENILNFNEYIKKAKKKIVK